MNQESYIPGCPTMITETLYKPQEDYLFVNNLKIKEFINDPKFKREVQGPIIKEYCQYYEADKPKPNSLYSPLNINNINNNNIDNIDINNNNINRQCNPLVAYPFGVPHKYKKEKCSKCKGNATFGKKKRSKKNINNENGNNNNDLFTSTLKDENLNSATCWSNSLNNINKNKPLSNCVINSYAKGNFKTASFKSINLSDLNNNLEQKKKYSTLYQENFDIHTLNNSNQFNNYNLSNDINNITSYQTEEYFLRNDSCSKNSLSCFTDTNRHSGQKNSLLINNQVLYNIPNNIHDEIINSKEINSNNIISSKSIDNKSPPKDKGKLYLKLNNTRINEYSNILSSEGICESYATDITTDKIKKTEEKTTKGRKKVKISTHRKEEKEKKEETNNTNDNNEIINEHVEIPKKKSLKMKTTDSEKDKSEIKKNTNPTVISDLTLINEQDTKKNKDPVKKFKNKKTTPIRKISLIPSNSSRKTSGETYLRMCKMQLAIDTQIKSNQIIPTSNKGMLNSEDELFGSNSSRNTYSKSRVIYLQEKKKEPKIKLSKETNNNLLVSPRANVNLNSNSNSIANSNLSVNKNLNKNINTHFNSNVSENAKTKINTELSSNNNLKKKKNIVPTKNIINTLSKGNSDFKSKKEDILISPRKNLHININNKTNKIGNKHIYLKKTPITRKLSNKSSNNISDRKSIRKNSAVSEIKNETNIPKRITRKSISGNVKNTNMSINKLLTNNNNNLSGSSKYKNGLLRKKISGTIKNNQDFKKTASHNNKTINDVQTKKIAANSLNKKKMTEIQKIIGNKNIITQIKEENSGNFESVSDSALMNESDRKKTKHAVKFGRSETKLYMPNHKIVPFKTTEVKMVTKNDSEKLKSKSVPKIGESDIALQRKVKEQNKKKINTTSATMQTTFANKNNIKGSIKNKKKELYDNILLLTKGMHKKGDIDTKINNTGKIIKNSDNKNIEQESESDVDTLNNKNKRIPINKDKKKEIIKKDKKENIKIIKKKDKVIEKKDKKIEDKE